MKLEWKILAYYLTFLFVILGVFALLIENLWNPIKKLWSNRRYQKPEITTTQEARNITVIKQQQNQNEKAQLFQTKKIEKEIQKRKTVKPIEIGQRLNEESAISKERRLREEQDKEFLESLQIDEQKEIKLQQKKDKIRKRAERKKLITDVAPLPPIEQNEGVCTIGIRLPNGTRLERRFYTTEKFQSVFNFIEVTSDMELDHFQLVTSFPRRVFSQNHEDTLEDIGLSQKILLVLENLEEEEE